MNLKDMPEILRRWIGAALIGLAPLYAIADCQDLDLSALLAATAIQPPGSVPFREERHTPMFKEPLVLTGTLEYLEPGVLRKRVETPFQESYLVEPDQVTIEKGGEIEVMRARQGRLIAGFLGGIESILAGDSEGLNDSFEPCAEGSMDAWTLGLKPRSRRLSRYLQGITVTGTSEAIESIRLDLDEEWHRIEILQAEETPAL
jgi:hypothetical protein